MPLEDCAECHARISESADTCPSCGASRTKKNKWKISDWISASSAAIASFVFVLGVTQYSFTEDWKRREFVAGQIKDFYADQINRAVLDMMDYNPVRVLLHPDKNGEERYREVDFEMLSRGIDGLYSTEDEFQIRKYFEHFLRSIYRFEYYIHYEAIEPIELCADFAYPVALMTANFDIWGKKLDDSDGDVNVYLLKEAINLYIETWDADPLRRFMEQIEATCN